VLLNAQAYMKANKCIKIKRFTLQERVVKWCGSFKSSTYRVGVVELERENGDA